MSEVRGIAKKATFIGGSIVAVAYFLPFVLVFVNAFKPKFEILANPLAWPKQISWDNFSQAMTKMNFFRSLTNSVIITVLSVGALILFSSMLAYYLARTKNKFTKTTFLILVASMIVPFQALMIPFMARFAQFVSWNNRGALIFFYIGFGVALSTFLYHGFISTIPTEIDEAASIDGASDMVAFWRIIFPMMRPITATVAISPADNHINALRVSVALSNKSRTRSSGRRSSEGGVGQYPSGQSSAERYSVGVIASSQE
jgi:raffinose/stachyose/melibiose transport system permease protein